VINVNYRWKRTVQSMTRNNTNVQVILLLFICKKKLIRTKMMLILKKIILLITIVITRRGIDFINWQRYRDFFVHTYCQSIYCDRRRC